MIKSINIVAENGKYRWELHKDLGELGNASYYGTVPLLEEAFDLIQEKMKPPEDRTVEDLILNNHVDVRFDVYGKRHFSNVITVNSNHYLVKTVSSNNLWLTIVLQCTSLGKVISRRKLKYEWRRTVEEALACHVEIVKNFRPQ